MPFGRFKQSSAAKLSHSLMYFFLVSPEIFINLNLIPTCPSVHVLFYTPHAAGVTRLQLIVPNILCRPSEGLCC